MATNETNRELLLDICRQQHLLPMSTRFQKPPHQLATWTKPGTGKGDPLDRQHYDQLDCILTPKRWKNGFKNVESELFANIDSDHAPVTAKIQIQSSPHKRTTKANMIVPLEEGKREGHSKDFLDTLNAIGSKNYGNICKALREASGRHFQARTINKQGCEWAPRTVELLQLRETQRMQGEWEAAAETSKLFRKMLNTDKTKHLQKMFSEELDL